MPPKPEVVINIQQGSVEADRTAEEVLADEFGDVISGDTSSIAALVKGAVDMMATVMTSGDLWRFSLDTFPEGDEVDECWETKKGALICG
ncbi:hypothetical protein IAR50_006241 [Cryptococcus sp. DSM 104548]